MSEQIAQEWLHQLAATANALNLEAHMNLISKKVNLMGVPGLAMNNGMPSASMSLKTNF